MAKTGDKGRDPKERRLRAPLQRVPAPANDNSDPDGRQKRGIVLAAVVLLAIAVLGVYARIH